MKIICRTDIKKIIDLGFKLNKTPKLTMQVEIEIANGIDIFIYIYLSDILIYHKFAIIKKCELIDAIKDIEKIIKYKKYRTLKHYKTLKLNRS